MWFKKEKEKEKEQDNIDLNTENFYYEQTKIEIEEMLGYIEMLCPKKGYGRHNHNLYRLLEKEVQRLSSERDKLSLKHGWVH
ncbi:hypothetical protein HN682_10225 [Candidatus Peregrinibacteria bacterium]|jgi:hypothetical protein|nr:hypothetical protein [Candidatus Peregrinibacteria bacterium]